MYSYLVSANTLAEKQRVSLVEMHKDGCPWKTRQCDGEYYLSRVMVLSHVGIASIYRIPLQAPATMAKDIKSNASKLESVLLDVEVKHPLVRASRLELLEMLMSVLDRGSGRLLALHHLFY